MNKGRCEVISTMFISGWIAKSSDRCMYVQAYLDNRVIGVSKADIIRPDLERLRAETNIEGRAFLITFDAPVSGERAMDVEVAIIGENIPLMRLPKMFIDRDPRLQILILGSPRSGTSELGNTITRQIGLPWLGETHAAQRFAEAAHALAGDAFSTNGLVRYMARQDLSQLSVDACRRAYYFMHRSASFVDKTPGIPMIESAPFLLRCFPEARVIYIKRSGISNVLSRLVKFGGSFEGHCADWAGAITSWMGLRPSLPSYLELRQESMLENPMAVALQIAMHLSVPELTDSIADSLRSGTLERTGAGIGRATLDQTDWSAPQIATFERVCGPAMKLAGYPMYRDSHIT